MYAARPPPLGIPGKALTRVELPFYDGSKGEDVQASVQMKREFVKHLNGKDYVLYAGLLDEAHQQGLKGIETQLVQVPSSQNGQLAICLAKVTMEKGTFTGLGDASPENVNRAMANALIRLAETRAKARALRDAVNVNMMAIEELGDTSESPAADAMNGSHGANGTPIPRLVPAVPLASVVEDEPRPRRIRETPGNGQTSAKPASDGAAATPTQVETVTKLARSLGRIVPTADMTRAAASELITRMSEERYGARR